jgi:Transposase DDE domain/Transposase domain (DUF772)
MAAGGPFGVVLARHGRGAGYQCFRSQSSPRWCGVCRLRPADAVGPARVCVLPGVRSSRQIERLCSTDVAFRVLCAQDAPDHCTIARFRADCQDAFAELFTQILVIAGRAGLAHFGTVAIDGTKIAANASIDANRSDEWLASQVADIVAQAARIDAAEDAAGDSDRSDRLPAALGDRTQRVRRIRQAAVEVAAQRMQRRHTVQARDATALDRRRRSEAGESVVGRIPNGPHRLAEARAHLAREITAHQAKLDRHAALIAAGRKPMGRPPIPMEASLRVRRARRVVDAAIAAEQAAPTRPTKKDGLPKDVANVTDPQSRLMPTRRGFIQGYNVQVAVSADQVIVAVQVGQSPNDLASLVPMMHAAQEVATVLRTVTGRPEHVIGTVLADAGYCSDANLGAPGPDRLIALSKSRDQAKSAQQQPVAGSPPAGLTPRQAMDHRLRTAEGISLYRRRGATVEPGIANLKKVMDRFSRRGLHSARSELHLAASAFNLMKIHRAQAS